MQTVLNRLPTVTLAGLLLRHAPRGRARHNLRLIAVGLGLAVMLPAADLHAQSLQARSSVPPLPAVVTITVHEQELNRTSDFIGHVQAIQSVDLHAQVAGYLKQVTFKGGQDVKQGELLYVIEPAQYEAAVEAAQAQSESAQASLKQAKQNLSQQEQLYVKESTPLSTLQQAQATYGVDKANVSAANAQLKTAQINLGYTRITSPIDGRIGATSVTAGNLVGPTTGTLTTIVQLNPIRVVFSINERSFVAFRQKNQQLTQQQINTRFIPKLLLPDGSMYSETGHVAFVNNQVDPATGTLAVYADFPNPRDLLLPGMLVTAVISPETPTHGFLLPAGALQQDQQGKYVLLVGKGNLVERRAVEIGTQIEQNIAVTSGLNNGDRIIVEGIQKVHPGQTVKPVAEGASPIGPSSSVESRAPAALGQ